MDDVACALACHHIAAYARTTWRTRNAFMVAIISVKHPFLGYKLTKGFA